MDPHTALRRQRDRIYDEYRTAPHSEFVYVVRLPVRRRAVSLSLDPEVPAACPGLRLALESGIGAAFGIHLDDPYPDEARRIIYSRAIGDPTPTYSPEGNGELLKLFEHVDSVGLAEPGDAWFSLAELVGFDGVVLDVLESGASSSLHGYVLSREAEPAPLSRFRNHLRRVGRILDGCPNIRLPKMLPPVRLLNYALLDASGGRALLGLGATSFYFARVGVERLARADVRLDYRVLADHHGGGLGWPEGDYFFVLEGDARLAVVDGIDLLLAQADDRPCDEPRFADEPSRAEASPAPQCPSVPAEEACEDVPATWPHWDAEGRVLRCGGRVCRSFSRAAATQFRLLEAFQSEGWPNFISDPFECDRQMRQTVEDLNKSLDENNSPIRFRVAAGRPGWYPREVVAAIADRPIPVPSRPTPVPSRTTPVWEPLTPV